MILPLVSMLQICSKSNNILFHELVYMDIGTGCENTGKIDFGFAAASATSRQWEVKVTQIECSSRSRYLHIY